VPELAVELVVEAEVGMVDQQVATIVKRLLVKMRSLDLMGQRELQQQQPQQPHSERSIRLALEIMVLLDKGAEAVAVAVAEDVMLGGQMHLALVVVVVVEAVVVVAQGQEVEVVEVRSPSMLQAQATLEP